MDRLWESPGSLFKPLSPEIGSACPAWLLLSARVLRTACRSPSVSPGFSSWLAWPDSGPSAPAGLSQCLVGDAGIGSCSDCISGTPAPHLQHRAQGLTLKLARAKRSALGAVQRVPQLWFSTCGCRPNTSPSFSGTYVTRAEATDADEPETDNSALRYSILEQGHPQLFSIDEHSGEIRTVQVGLDREVRPRRSLGGQGPGHQCHISTSWPPCWHAQPHEVLVSSWALGPGLAHRTQCPQQLEGVPSCCRHSWWLWGRAQTQLGMRVPRARVWR